MAKGLLRKALHGASKSASEVLAGKIEEKRQTRLMDYQAARQREGQDYAFGQQKELFGMEQQATTERDERLNQQAVQRSTFESGMRANLDRETADTAHARQTERDEAQSQQRMAEATHELEEKARLADGGKGIDLKTLSIYVPGPEGRGGETISLSGYVDPKDGSVWFIDPSTRGLVNSAQVQEENATQAFMANSQIVMNEVKGERRESAVRSAAQQWAEQYPGQMPLDDHLQMMGDQQRQWFEDEIRPQEAVPTTASPPGATASPAAATGATPNKTAIDRLLTRATQSPESSATPGEPPQGQGRTGSTLGRIRSAQWAHDLIAQGKLPSVSGGGATAEFNRRNLQQALDSGVLKAEEAELIRSVLGEQ